MNTHTAYCVDCDTPVAVTADIADLLADGEFVDVQCARCDAELDARLAADAHLEHAYDGQYELCDEYADLF